MDNPYSKILEMTRNRGGNLSGISIGEVLAPPPNLVVRVGELQVDKDNIKIADYLLKEYQREYKTSPDEVIWSVRNYIKFEDTLAVGDEVAIFTTADKQTYIILARLVNL